ncbi:MAG: DNA gyrase subunit A [Clostridiales bacterium]|nr:DNA gyrase subunit A [Clostridiales bacterium]
MDRNEIDQIIEKNNTGKILEVKVKDELEKSFIAYAMAVNVSRAIPDVRDGLKPVHRRILYTMGGELNLFNDKPFKKCARIVGDVMGKYHPHGDAAIYDALVRLAQDFTINSPLVEGHGNFGSVDGDSAAAMRYTEARLSKISAEMLNTIDKETVDFYPNFDDTLQQPVVLPARFPNLLVNGSDGIAVGMATNIPPHNLSEVCDGVVAMIDNKDIDIEELMKYIPAPDFPTKGYILGIKGVKDAYRTGRGTCYIRAKAEIEEYNNGTRSRIVITEIPYQVNKAKLIMQMADLVKNKKIEGISDIKEESDREGMRIVVDIKRDANAQVVLNSLYKHTQLQISFGIIMLALVNGAPKICNLQEIIHHFLEFQKEIIIRRTKFDLDKAEQKEHILAGLVIAQANIDEVIKQIKISEDKNDAIERLTKLFELSEKQAQAILDMRLQKLTGLEVEKLKAELQETQELIRELRSILESDEKVLAIIKQDLLDIKAKYGVPRKSQISYDYSDIDIADLIEKEDVIITLTHGGYIKRMAMSEYKAQHRGGMGVSSHKTKEEDWVDNIFMTNTHDDLFCFSDKGKVYTIKSYEVPEAQKQSKGRAIVNILQVDQGERITTIIPVKEEDREGKNLLMCTKNGLIKKTKISEFDSIRKGGKLAIRLSEDDALIGVYVTSEDDEIILASNNGKCIRFKESDIRLVGRDAIGVRGMKLRDDDYLVDIVLIDPSHDIITVTENGYGKRSRQEEYRLQGRYGLGVMAGVFNDQTGRLVSLKQISDDNDLILICDDGQVIRLKASEINTIGRNTKGVRLMKVKGNTKVVAIAVVPHEPEEEEVPANEVSNTEFADTNDSNVVTE